MVGRWKVTIPRMVTIQLQPFLPYTNLAPKKFLLDRNLALKFHYQTGLSMSSLRWTSSTKATYLLQQEYKTNNGWLSFAVPKRKKSSLSIFFSLPLPILLTPSPLKTMRFTWRWRVYPILPEKNCLWLLSLTVQHNWAKNGNVISCLNQNNVCGIVHAHVCRRDNIFLMNGNKLA